MRALPRRVRHSRIDACRSGGNAGQRGLSSSPSAAATIATRRAACSAAPTRRRHTRRIPMSVSAIPPPGSGSAADLRRPTGHGLGNWTTDQIVTAFTKGSCRTGAIFRRSCLAGALAPYRDDALAIAAYLQSLPAVKNAVPGPYKASETPAVGNISVIIPTAVYSKLPKP